MVNPAAVSGSQSPASSSSKNRRSFTVCCGHRLSFRAETIFDAILDGVTWTVEKFVLILGPLLICFALGIMSGLSWTFFTILVPMMQHKHEDNPFGHWIIMGHIGIVIFLLVEICFNYFLCVITPTKGKNFDQVVRELALATNMEYPETPQAVDAFRRDFEDRMMIRMRRRQQRAAQEQEQAQVLKEHEQQQLNETDGDTETAGAGTVKNRKAAKSKASSSSNKKPPPTPQQLRSWMLMAPDEWGFCQRSKQPKPPRSHYDHVSKTLVLSLDHYCPWMFNAVGYFNYRYFCNFLWYVLLGMFYGAVVAFEPFRNTSGPLYKHQVQEFRRTGTWKHIYPMVPINTERLPISLAFMLCLAIGIAVACLGGFHLYLCLTAQTTIEFHGNFMNRRKAARLNKKWKNPYDLGWRRNFQQVYGSSLPAWKAFLIPSRREPEYLPLPLPGEDGIRANYRSKSIEIVTNDKIPSSVAATTRGAEIV